MILNATDYEQRMQLLIEECAYKEVKRNPLSSMIRECNAMRSRIGKMFSPRLQRSLNVSNPIIAKLYGLPKIHKPGNKMRPTVSNVNTPCYKMAKWLVKEIKKIPAFDTLSVKNSFHFVQKTADIILNDNGFVRCFLFVSKHSG